MMGRRARRARRVIKRVNIAMRVRRVRRARRVIKRVDIAMRMRRTAG